jgi:D-alanyl-D-alanine carboxypeptidase/D-alanyl-D-alanine-endopeptidase (penicillin-binding protein 4)
VAIAAVAAGTAGAQPNPVSSLVERFGKKNPTVSVLVERLDPSGPATIASWRPGTALAPASTMKIITGASSLMTVGPDFRFTTRVEAGPDSLAADGTVDGPAYLIGSGDPMLATRAYSRARLDGLGTPLEDLARNVSENGIGRITGGIVVDETLFDRQRMGPLWKSSYRPAALGHRDQPEPGRQRIQRVEPGHRGGAAPRRRAEAPGREGHGPRACRSRPARW